MTAQPVTQGGDVSLNYFFQFNQPAAQNATIRVYLDNDANPYNGNQGQFFQSIESGAGTNVLPRQFSINTGSILPGQYYVYAQIVYGAHTRYLHAPGRLVIRSPLSLAITSLGDQGIITWPTNAIGFMLESTADLLLSNSWSPVSPAPIIINGQNTVTNTIGTGSQFYRLKN